MSNSTTASSNSTVTTAAAEKLQRNRPVYLPMEIPIEAPEPAPHNPHADTHHDDQLTSPHTHSTSEQQQEAKSSSHSEDTLHAADSSSSSLGIMRTSRSPTVSILGARHLKVVKRTKLKKGGIKYEVEQTVVTLSPVFPPALSPAVDTPPTVPVVAKDPAMHPSFTTSHAESPSLLFAYDLPAERDTGNIEYKWKLVDKAADRLVHLTTQLNYRLSEGGGFMLYELGVQDNGFAQGLSTEHLDASIDTVKAMADSLKCDVKCLVRAWGHEGVVAEILVRRIGDSSTSTTTAEIDAANAAAASTSMSPSLSASASPSPVHPGDLRIALLGQSSSGKTSLLGCLLSNQCDDGRGRSRLHVFRHRHEIENGRTSAIARQIVGFDVRGNITNYQVHHRQTLGVNNAVDSATSNIASSTSSMLAATPPKKEKGLSSLFGDDDDAGSEEDEDEERSNQDSSSEPTSPFVMDSSEPTISFQSFPSSVPSANAAPSTSLSLNGSTNTSGASQACSVADWQRILEHSYKVYTIYDLPSDYFKTTIYGLIGTSCPDYCCIVVAAPTTNSTTDEIGVTNASSDSSHHVVSSQTREQIMICCALGLPFFLVLCKSDLTSPEMKEKIIKSLTNICAEAYVPTQHRHTNNGSKNTSNSTIITNKIPLVLSSTSAVEIELLERNMTESLSDADLPASHRASIMKGVQQKHRSNTSSTSSYIFPSHTFTPLFVLSNVTGEGIDVFKHYLFHLHNYRADYWSQKVVSSEGKPRQVEFSIDEIFTVDTVGSVVSGTILRGVIHEGDTLLMGPITPSDESTTSGTSAIASSSLASSASDEAAQMFRPVLVKSIHISRKCFRNAKAGQSVTLALKKVDRNLLRRGMVLVSMPTPIPAVPPNLTLASPPTLPSWPRSCVGFEAYIRMFDLPNAINSFVALSNIGANGRSSISTTRTGLAQSLGLRYQPIIHVGNVRQSAEIVAIRVVNEPVQPQVEKWIAENCTEETEGERDVSSVLDRLESANDITSASSTPSSSFSSSSTPSRVSCVLVRFEFLYQSEYLRLGRQVLFREERTRGTGIITKLYYVDGEIEEQADDAELVKAASTMTVTVTADTTSLTSSPDPRSDNSSPDETQARDAMSSSYPSLQTLPNTQQPPSAGAGKQRKKSVSSGSPANISTSPSNVFQRAKERRRAAEAARFAQEAATLGELPSEMSQVTLHPSSRSPLIASLPTPSDGTSAATTAVRRASPTLQQLQSNFAASVPNTPALCPQAVPSSLGKSFLTTPIHQSFTRRQSDCVTSPLMLHASPPASIGTTSCASPLTTGSRRSPPHSASDPALSAWRRTPDKTNATATAHTPSASDHLESFQLPESSAGFQSILTSQPLTRITSVGSNHSESSHDSRSSPLTIASGSSFLISHSPPDLIGPTHSSTDDAASSSEDEDPNSISDLFGHVKEDKPRAPKKQMTPEQLEKKRKQDEKRAGNMRKP